MAEHSSDRLPVTLLTGFLGSGKTTLLNRLVRTPDFARTAVIINEFGDIGLDHELVVPTSETMVLLQSGCVCCSIRSDLLDALNEIADRRAAGEILVDRVLIETTGLAEPGPILHSLMAGYADADFRLEGVVVTVDACAGLATFERHPEARAQVALADRLLLTKDDIADPSDVVAVEERLRRLNPSAPILRVLHGEVDPTALFAQAGEPQTSAAAADWLAADSYPAPDPTSVIHAHGDDIRAVSWTIEHPVSGAALDLWMSALMSIAGPDMLRLKGIIHIDGMPWPVAVHGVQHVIHPAVPLRDWSGADRRTRLVLITRGFTEAELHDALRFLGELNSRQAGDASRTTDAPA